MKSTRPRKQPPPPPPPPLINNGGSGVDQNDILTAVQETWVHHSQSHQSQQSQGQDDQLTAIEEDGHDLNYGPRNGLQERARGNNNGQLPHIPEDPDPLETAVDQDPEDEDGDGDEDEMDEEASKKSLRSIVPLPSTGGVKFALPPSHQSSSKIQRDLPGRNVSSPPSSSTSNPNSNGKNNINNNNNMSSMDRNGNSAGKMGKTGMTQPASSYWLDSFHHPFLELDADTVCLLTSNSHSSTSSNATSNDKNGNSNKNKVNKTKPEIVSLRRGEVVHRTTTAVSDTPTNQTIDQENCEVVFYRDGRVVGVLEDLSIGGGVDGGVVAAVSVNTRSPFRKQHSSPSNANNSNTYNSKRSTSLSTSTSKSSKKPHRRRRKKDLDQSDDSEDEDEVDRKYTDTECGEVVCLAIGDGVIECDPVSYEVMHVLNVEMDEPNTAEVEIYTHFLTSLQNNNQNSQSMGRQNKPPNNDEGAIDELVDRLMKEVSMLSPFSEHLIQHHTALRKKREYGVSDEEDAPISIGMFQGFQWDWLMRRQFITAMSVLKRFQGQDMPDEYIVIGTETGQLLIVDLKVHSIVLRVRFQEAVSLISCEGEFESSYCVYVVLRDGGLYSLSNGGKVAFVTSFSAIPVSMVSYDGSAVVACADSTIYSYTYYSRQNFQIRLDSRITCMKNLVLRERGVHMFAIGLENKQVLIYKDERLVSTVFLEDVPRNMVFGRFGGEQHSLVVIGANGGLLVKMLKRTAVFEIGQNIKGSGPSQEQELVIPIPPKSKLYVQEQDRQVRHAPAVNRAFQESLDNLRKQIQKVHSDVVVDTAPANETTDIGGETKQNIKLQIQTEVTGIGPLYKIQVTVSHMSEAEVFYHGLQMMISPQSKHILISPRILTLPLLAPQRNYKFIIMARLDDTEPGETDATNGGGNNNKNHIVSFLVGKGGDVVSTALLNLTADQQ